MKNKIYDVCIIGGGPAGLTAAIYSARYKLKTLLVTKLLGGSVTEANKISNFPSYKEIKGIELAKKLIEQVKSYDVDIKEEEVIDIKKEKNFIVKTKNAQYEAKKIILAIGREKIKLNLEKEDKFLGRGISYCATCDAPLYKNKIVAVVGGGNSAIHSALLLSEYAKKIYIIYRGKEFLKADPILIEQIKKNKKIKILFNSTISEIIGEEKLEGIKLKNRKKIKLDGIFIEIGRKPNIQIISSLKIKEKDGYIIVDKNQKTNIDGIYAAGDITTNPLKQIITACAEGAIAATSVYNELKNK